MDSGERLALKSAHESLAQIDNAKYEELKNKNPKSTQEQGIFEQWTASRTRLAQINAGIAELEASKESSDNNDRQAEALIASLKKLGE